MILTKEILHNLVDSINEYDNKLVYDFLNNLLHKEMDLADYLDRHCNYVDEEEQKEISEILSKTDITDEGREIDIDTFLQSQI